MDDDRGTYRVEQLGRPQPPSGVQQNEDVATLEALVTHHPGNNRAIHMIDGAIVGAENPVRRSHAFIGGDFEEVIDRRVDRYGTLGADQVLLVKDFILEDPNPSPGTEVRAVDVPSPTAGYVSSVRPNAGFVEIMDREGGAVIARLRHMSDIGVQVGDTITYGQRLGQQNNLGLDRPPGVGMHAHVEMDTGHYQQFQNYMADLVSGRLPVQTQYRENVQPIPVVADGIFRLGQSDPRLQDLQRVMAGEGYRATGGGPLDQDGVYRPSMQGALLDFQRTHGLSQTGDADSATLRLAPSLPTREVDRNDRFLPGQAPMVPIGPEVRAPGHPDHTDHRPALPDPLAPSVNQSATGGRGPGDTAHPDHAMLEQIRAGVRTIDEQIGKPFDEKSERASRALLAACKDNREAYPDAGGFSLAGNALSRVDHIALGPTGNLFAVEGRLDDPAHKRAFVSMEQAIDTPVEQSDGKLLAANQGIAQERAMAQQQDMARSVKDLNKVAGRQMG